MEPTARLYLCARCRDQVVICSHCDRGQRYCANGCARVARNESLRAAGRRYQSTRRGRHRHAERQRRYRQRQREKVTHQGSPVAGADDSLSIEPRRPPSMPGVSVLAAAGGLICHFCGRVCAVLVRLGFTRRRPSRRPLSLLAVRTDHEHSP